MNTLRLAIACLALATATPSALHAQSVGAAALERTLTGNQWEVITETGQRAWGNIRFRERREFSTMNGPNGAWKLTGERTLELGSMYAVEFAPGLESFVVTMKEGGAKVATGRKTAATSTASRLNPSTTPIALTTSKPVEPGFMPLLDPAHEKQWKLCGPNPVSLQNGIIDTASPKSAEPSYLWYSGKKFGDFVLRFDVKLSGRCNSGVWIRFDNPGQDTNKVHGVGYQIDFSYGRGIGSVCVHRRCIKESSVIVREKLADWNEIEISVVGPRIRVGFNGQQINECEVGAEPTGYIGIENWEGGSGVQFRNMRIQEVKPQVVSAPPSITPPSLVAGTIPDPLGLKGAIPLPAQPPAPTAPPTVPPQPLKPTSPALTPATVAKKLLSFPRAILGVWEWHDEANYIQAGDVKVAKPGAWTHVRLYDDGSANAWHEKQIVWEGKWEVIGEDSVKIVDRKFVHVLKFAEDLTTLTVTTKPATTGRKVGIAHRDPIVGDWHWGRGINHVREDGTANENGVWKRLPDGRYEFNWSQGKYIDKATLTQDGQKLHGTNLKKEKFTSERVKK